MKDYIEWSKVKSKTNNRANYPTDFYAGQVWWCKIGENIGVEIDGKGSSFARPVLILRKFNYKSFLGIPLTSQTKEPHPYYYPITIKERQGLLLLNQIRTWDAARLNRRIANLNPQKFANIKRITSNFIIS